jgi:hypothetical protein
MFYKKFFQLIHMLKKWQKVYKYIAIICSKKMVKKTYATCQD